MQLDTYSSLLEAVEFRPIVRDKAFSENSVMFTTLLAKYPDDSGASETSVCERHEND